jgi:hypothetical protein
MGDYIIDYMEDTMKLYKLTDENGMTWGRTQWGEGVTHEATGPMDAPLCSNGWIHAYEHPLLAVLLNPIHADFDKPRLWEAEGEIGLRDGQLKCGCRKLTTVRELSVPKMTTEQRVKFAILCAKTVEKGVAWNAWADGWLNGKDRSEEAAAAWAAEAAEAAARAAWAAAAEAAAWAAEATAWAAEATARAAWAAEAAARAAEATAWAAEATARAAEAAWAAEAARAARAAEATARAAEAAWAAVSDPKIDLIKIAEEAVR